jgi:ketosteroid isomerase-like protein
VFDWLFEGRSEVYWLLGVLAAVLLILWWWLRKRGLLIAVGVVAAFAGLYFVLDKLVETDREQIERKVREMAAAVTRRDPDAVFQHVSDQFASPQGKGKAEFKEVAKGYINSGAAGEVVVWGFEFKQDVPRDKPLAPVAFMVKAKGNKFGVGDEASFRCEATFHRDADGQWRLKGFKLFDALGTQQIPLPF